MNRSTCIRSISVRAGNTESLHFTFVNERTLSLIIQNVMRIVRIPLPLQTGKAWGKKQRGHTPLRRCPLFECGVWELNPPGYRSRQTLRKTTGQCSQHLNNMCKLVGIALRSWDRKPSPIGQRRIFVDWSSAAGSVTDDLIILIDWTCIFDLALYDVRLYRI